MHGHGLIVDKQVEAERTYLFDVQEILGSVVEYFLFEFFHLIRSQESHLRNLVEGPLNVTVSLAARKFTLALQMKFRVKL